LQWLMTLHLMHQSSHWYITEYFEINCRLAPSLLKYILRIPAVIYGKCFYYHTVDRALQSRQHCQSLYNVTHSPASQLLLASSALNKGCD
jgi:hypothetical protein